MPLPHPAADEDRDTFIQRCMGDSKASEEFPDETQRLAVCQAQFDGESFTAESFEEFYGGWAIGKDTVLSVQAVPCGERVHLDTDNELSELPEGVRESSQELPSCVLDARIQESKGYVLDVLEYKGEDVRDKPLNERESILRSLPLRDSLQLCKPAKVLASDKVGLKFDIQDFFDEGVNTVIVRETDSHYNDVASQAFISILQEQEPETNTGETDSIRESVSLAIREADTKNGLEIILIRAGKSLNQGENGPIYYSPDELQSAVERGVFEGAPIHMFSFEACDPNSGLCSTIRDHLPEGVLFEIDQGRIPHPTDHIAGYLWDVEWDTELEAIVSRNPQFVDNDKGKDALNVIRASLNGESNHPLGVSIVASGRREPAEVNGESVTAVKDIQEIDAWLDIVDHPAAGGAFRLSEAENHINSLSKENSMPSTCDKVRQTFAENLENLGLTQEQVNQYLGESGDIDPNQLVELVKSYVSQEDNDTEDEPSVESIHETYKLAFQKATENELDAESTQKLLDEVNGQALNESTLDQLVEKYLPEPEPQNDADDDNELKSQVEALQNELAKRDTRELVRRKLEESNLLNDPAGERILTETKDQVLKEEDIDQLIQREQEYKNKVAESIDRTKVTDNPEPDNDGDIESRVEEIANL